MPFGYNKKQFTYILRDIIGVTAVQLVFVGLEMDSKFSLEIRIMDQKTLDIFIHRFKIYILLVLVWIILVGIYFLYSYGVRGMLLYIVISLVLFGYIAYSYHMLLNKISKNFNLKIRYFNHNQ